MIRYLDPDDPSFPAQDLKPYSDYDQALRKVAEMKAIGPHKELNYFLEERSYEVKS